VTVRPWQWGLRARTLWASLFCWGGPYPLSAVLQNIVESHQIRATELAGATMLTDREAVLRFALSQCRTIEGSVLEFGVYQGATLRLLAGEAGGRRSLVGFDSFKGLPEDWGTLLPKGHFETELPAFPREYNIRLEVGRIEDTLPQFLAREPGAIALVHIDCDLYPTTRFVLDHVLPHMPAGGVVVFDEYYGYPTFSEHEYRAWREVRQAGSGSARPLAYSSHSCAYQIERPWTR
jgi:Methyltransferase domain